MIQRFNTLFLVIICNSFIQAEVTIPAQPGTSTVINIGSVNSSLHNSNENKNAATQSGASALDDKKILILYQQTVESLCKLFSQQQKNASAKIQAHPYITLALISALSYASLNYHLYCMTSLINQHDAWSNWKAAVSLTHLQLCNPQELMDQLKTDMYKKYAFNASNIFDTDYTNLFVHDLKTEITCIDTYIYWYQLLKKCKCSKFFYCTIDLEIAQEKKARLLFLLDFFMAWYSKYHENIISSRLA